MSAVHDPGLPASPRPLIDAQILREQCESAWTRAVEGLAGSGDARLTPQVEVREAVDSTNRVLMDLPFAADGEAAAPRLLVALRQTAGRGRRGRSWVSPPATSLTFSVALERTGAAPVSGAWSLWVGLALAEVLSPWVPDIALKWPNDLQRAGRKCAGILCETRRQAGLAGLERVVTGIGLNLLADPERESVDQPIAALFDDVLPRSREGLLAAIVAALGRRWLQFGAAGPADPVDLCRQWAVFDALAGQQVVILDQGRIVAEGTALGVDASGALQVRVGDEVRSLNFGEVSVRTRAAYDEAS